MSHTEPQLQDSFINAGGMAARFIDQFLAEIPAASASCTPETLSTIAYPHFKKALNASVLQRNIVDVKQRKYAMSETFIDSILSFVKHTNVSTLNSVDKRAHEEFSEKLKIVQHVFASKSLEDALKTLPSKMHSAPSAPAQE